MGKGDWMPLDAYIERNREAIIESVQDLISIPSVKGEAVEGRPLGNGPGKALEHVLDLGKKLGFKVRNVDGYAGYGEIGTGDEIIGILGHLDVVPAGDDWTYPPFSGEIHDGRIYGRGAIDNKGPTIGAMYAMKAVLESGLPINKRVRIIFGTDEESEWQGIKYYLKKEPMPDFGIVPDANYPVIHAEKGILSIALKKEFDGEEETSNIEYIKGGHRVNMVPDRCECSFITKRDSDKILTHLNTFKEYAQYDMRADFNSEDGRLFIESTGKSAHGSTPQLGINAIGQMLAFLCTLGLEGGPMEDFIMFLNNKIGMDTKGEMLGIKCSDDVSGELTVNLGVVDIDRARGVALIDIRYPVTYKLAKIMNNIYEIAGEYGIEVEIIGHNPPLYVPKDDALVKKLLDVYTEMTGEKAEPITTGGGTYARALDYAVAFGAQFPGRPDLAHQRDEYIDIEDLLLHTKIYARAIAELAK